MKKIVIGFCVVVAVAAMFSCSTSENISPSKNSLGIVVPGSSNGNNSFNLLMLKDGRTANPVSGIPNFGSITLGTKLSISFTEGSTRNGIIDIHVSKCNSANDSSFTPNPTVKDSTSLDSLVGTYSGHVYKFVPSPNTKDTTRTISSDTLSLTLRNNNTYTCTGLATGYPGAGSGKFSLSHGTFFWYGTIIFKDDHNHSNTVLNGPFVYYVNRRVLNLNTTINGIHYSFYLRKN